MKESRLEENGYTRGLKTGSFNYLENAKAIDLTEKIEYKYGNATNISNSSIKHDLDITFNGGKAGRGISKFYGSGYFKNNRALSALKEIYYLDLKSLNWGELGLAKTYNASEFKVYARLKMDTVPGIGYKLNYVATTKDAIVETKDTGGWTNRTGARRTDFEHRALMRGGNLITTNNLSDTMPWPTGPGGGDWLPCCIAGTLPPIEGLDEGWPSSGTFGTLLPAKLLPNCDKCVKLCESKACKDLKNPDECRDCTIECVKNCNWTCSENDCQGFECINTYEGDIDFASLKQIGKEVAAIWVDQVYDLESSYTRRNEKFLDDFESTSVTRINYTIRIKNSGDIKLNDVMLNDTLPGRAVFVSAEIRDSKKRIEPDDLEENDDGTTKTVRFKLGDLDTSSEILVNFTVKFKADEITTEDKFKENVVEASGLALGKLFKKTSNVAQVALTAEDK